MKKFRYAFIFIATFWFAVVASSETLNMEFVRTISEMLIWVGFGVFAGELFFGESE